MFIRIFIIFLVYVSITSQTRCTCLWPGTTGMIKDTKKLERGFKNKMTEFAQNYDDHLYIQVIIDSGNTGYEAVARE